MAHRHDGWWGYDYDVVRVGNKFYVYYEPWWGNYQLQQITPDTLSAQAAVELLDPGGQAYESFSFWEHLTLDVLGLIPVLGIPADLANAAWYAVEDDWTNAGLSGVAAIPAAGYSVAGLQAAKYGQRGAEASARLLKWSRTADVAHNVAESGYCIVEGVRNRAPLAAGMGAFGLAVNTHVVLKWRRAVASAHPHTTKRLPQTLNDVNLKGIFQSFGMNPAAEGKFFGWKPGFVARPPESFSKSELLKRGWTCDRLEQVAEAYEHIARITPSNPSAAGRARQLREIIALFFQEGFALMSKAETVFFIENETNKPLDVFVEPEGLAVSLPPGDKLTVRDNYDKLPLVLRVSNDSSGNLALSLWPGDGNMKVEKNGTEII